VTEGNLVYDNAISDSEIGIRATRSHNNIVENITFSDIESSEYRLLADSNLMIRGQQFDNALISGGGEDMTATDTAADTAIENLVEIAGSGIIEVTEEANDGEDDDDEEAEANSYNTDTQPYTTTLGDGDSITVNS
jgi:parallel beta-helix repeat protein